MANGVQLELRVFPNALLELLRAYVDGGRGRRQAHSTSTPQHALLKLLLIEAYIAGQGGRRQANQPPFSGNDDINDRRWPWRTLSLTRNLKSLILAGIDINDQHSLLAEEVAPLPPQPSSYDGRQVRWTGAVEVAVL